MGDIVRGNDICSPLLQLVSRIDKEIIYLSPPIPPFSASPSVRSGAYSEFSPGGGIKWCQEW